MAAINCYSYIRLSAKRIDIEEYKRRAETFNIHRCWEWVEGVIIYELPSMPHEIVIGAIVKQIIKH